MSILKVTLVVLITSVALLGLMARFTALPAPFPENSASAQWLARGPYAIGFQEVTLTDHSRPTNANGKAAGSPHRTLKTNVWFPLNADGTAVADGRHPLLVHSHGFSSNREEGRYLAREMASLGYIVMSADFPLTNMRAPGGPRLADVVNQPGDVSFLIDTALNWDHAQGHMFYQHVDANRIATTGVSLGGLTTTLLAFHGRLHDPRLKAAISIAGPTTMFSAAYFQQPGPDFMMIAGSVDAIVPYDRNAASLLEKAPQALLATLQGASHTGFADAARWLRWMKNPDALGCAVVKFRKPESSPGDFYAELQAGSAGIVEDRRSDFCTTDPLPPAMNALMQQRLTQLLVTAFLQSHFANSEAERSAARQFLLETLPAEQPAITVQGGR